MPALLVHIPNRNIRIPMRKLTIAEIMMELDLALPVAAPIVTAPIQIERVDGELRIRDIDLAVRLEFATPVDIRKLVRRYSAELARLGVIATAAITSGAGGGRPGTQFYLNRKQAIFVTGKSETARATDITIEIIEQFDAYERGATPPAPVTREQVLASAVLLADQAIKEYAAQIATLAPKAEALDRIAAADGTFSLQEAAKALQVRPKDFVAFMTTHGWLYRRPGSGTLLGYSSQTNAGYLTHKVTTLHLDTGPDKVVEQVKVTASGLAKLAKLMPGRLAVVAAE